MKIAFISTYPPRKCGLATFCENMIIHLLAEIQTSDKIDVYALNTTENQINYTSPVRQLISENIKEDYSNAADKINSDYDVCIVQFEHGIYGGQAGLYLLSLLCRLKIPIISILHTALDYPTFHQRLVVSQIAKFSKKVVVMAKTAIQFLTESYGVDSSKIAVIEHGLPDYENRQAKSTKSEFGWEGKNILMTFGLISEGKGFEYVIKALPRVIKLFPNTLFIIIGQTHPSIVKKEGESYRDSLIKLMFELKVQEHVVFINRHVSELELMNYLGVADIYLCPYLNEKQITSGTLSYALGSGAAIIATPFWHAKELCDENYILNVPFQNHELFATEINHLLENPDCLNYYKTKAINYGYSLSWPKITKRYLKLIDDVINTKNTVTSKPVFPEIDFSYLRSITNTNGVMQHADPNGINYNEGYCLDDNARALNCVIEFHEVFHSTAQDHIIDTYLKFIERAHLRSGKFLNFASYPLLSFAPNYSEDAFGRTIWALGCLMNSPTLKGFHQRAKQLLKRVASEISILQSPRGVANCLIGYSLLNDVGTVHYLANRMLAWHKHFENTDWVWFENYLTYDNAILPLSLFYAYECTGTNKYLTTAINTLHFLNSVHFQDGFLSVVGNNGWFIKNQSKAEFSQQPIDAMASLLANSKAFQLTNEIAFKTYALKSMSWFYGENILSAPIYDQYTKSCHDGLNSKSVTENQGAESNIVYLLSRIEIEKLIV